jgi:hypothetical protein
MPHLHTTEFAYAAVKETEAVEEDQDKRCLCIT